MTWMQAEEAECPDDKPCSAVAAVVIPKPRDLGDLEVRRVLPAAARRSVGPFVFFDHFGPVDFAPGQGINVRPHPHIGLATITWLTDGEILHRDSLGFVQPIRPGEVNWMTAGSGIVHSERTPESLADDAHRLAGLQAWVALPRAHEETTPSFEHYAADRIPRGDDDSVQVSVIAGSAFGLHSPVKTFQEIVYAELRMAGGAEVPLPLDVEERGVYVYEGAVEIEGTRFEAGRLVALEPAREVRVRAVRGARLYLVGGEPLDAPRHVWWNFVSSSRERIEQAKADWRGGRFAKVPGDDEFIPLPES